MFASAAARFSALTASQISSRYTGISLLASMPRRTVDPVISRTVILTSSPRQIPSPDLRVMTSISGLLALDRGCLHRHLCLCRQHVVQLHLCEQRMPNSVPTCVVDDLTSHQSLLVDDQRTREIDGEVSQTLGGLHDAEDQRVVSPLETEPTGVVVGNPGL